MLLFIDSRWIRDKYEIQSIKKLSRRKYNRIFISVLEGNKFISIKNGGYHQEQDRCAEIHKAKDFCTIKSNKINTRRRATEKGNVFEYNQKNLLSKLYKNMIKYIKSLYIVEFGVETQISQNKRSKKMKRKC